MPSVDIIVKQKFNNGIREWEATLVDPSNGKWAITGSTYYEAVGKLIDSYRNIFGIVIHKQR